MHTHFESTSKISSPHKEDGQQCLSVLEKKPVDIKREDSNCQSPPSWRAPWCCKFETPASPSKLFSQCNVNFLVSGWCLWYEPGASGEIWACRRCVPKMHFRKSAVRRHHIELFLQLNEANCRKKKTFLTSLKTRFKVQTIFLSAFEKRKCTKNGFSPITISHCTRMIVLVGNMLVQSSCHVPLSHGIKRCGFVPRPASAAVPAKFEPSENILRLGDKRGLDRSALRCSL